MVEVHRKQVNYVNCWNATALYYAAHGGHKAVVEYLLESGAQCTEGEFLSERCFYGALTDEIRNVLRQYKYTASSRSPYREFWRLTWEARQQHSDFAFLFGDGGVALPCHKLVLAVRCPRFADMLLPPGGAWAACATKTVKVPRSALTPILSWLYTSKMDVPEADVEVTATALTALGLAREADLLLAEVKEQGNEVRNTHARAHPFRFHRLTLFLLIIAPQLVTQSCPPRQKGARRHCGGERQPKPDACVAGLRSQPPVGLATAPTPAFAGVPALFRRVCVRRGVQ